MGKKGRGRSLRFRPKKPPKTCEICESENIKYVLFDNAFRIDCYAKHCGHEQTIWRTKEEEEQGHYTFTVFLGEKKLLKQKFSCDYFKPDKDVKK